MIWNASQQNSRCFCMENIPWYTVSNHYAFNSLYVTSRKETKKKKKGNLKHITWFKQRCFGSYQQFCVRSHATVEGHSCQATKYLIASSTSSLYSYLGIRKRKETISCMNRCDIFLDSSNIWSSDIFLNLSDTWSSDQSTVHNTYLELCIYYLTKNTQQRTNHAP